jgi:hypothetical protein
MFQNFSATFFFGQILSPAAPQGCVRKWISWKELFWGWGVSESVMVHFWACWSVYIYFSFHFKPSYYGFRVPGNGIRNRHPYLRPNFELKFRFGACVSAIKDCKTMTVFWDFDYQKFIFIENKLLIRNQQSKIHRKLYVSSKCISRQNFTYRGPQGKNRWKNLREEYREILSRIIFQWYIEFSVYFWLLIPNMTFIFYENEFLTVKIWKYSHIFAIPACWYGKNGFSQQQ